MVAKDWNDAGKRIMIKKIKYEEDFESPIIVDLSREHAKRGYSSTIAFIDKEAIFCSSLYYKELTLAYKQANSLPLED